MIREHNRERLYFIAQILLIGCLIFYISVIFSMKSGSDRSFKEVAKPLEAAGKKENLRKADARQIKRLYKLNVEEYEGVLLMHASSAMDVNEILLVKAKNEKQLEEIRKRVEERNETLIQTFEGYGAKQTKLLKNVVIETKGKFLFLTVSNNAAQLLETFKKNL